MTELSALAGSEGYAAYDDDGGTLLSQKAVDGLLGQF